MIPMDDDGPIFDKCPGCQDSLVAGNVDQCNACEVAMCISCKKKHVERNPTHKRVSTRPGRIARSSFGFN